MKKGVKLLIFSIPIILLTSLVVAINAPAPTPGTNLPANPFQGISDLLTGLLKVVGDVFGMAVGAKPFGLGEAVFARMIIFILVTAVLYWPADKISKGKKTISLIIAAGVALLGVRFISESLVSAILLPYSVTVLTISTLLPMALYGILIYNEDLPAFIRKCGWWFFFVVWVAMYIWRAPKLVGTASADMYIISGGISLIAALIDKPLKEMIDKMKLALSEAQGKISILEKERNKYKNELEDAIRARNLGISDGTLTGEGLTKFNDNVKKLETILENIDKMYARYKAGGKRSTKAKQS